MATETDPAPVGVQLYTVEEAAELLHCSTSRLRKLISDRLIPSTKIGKQRLFTDAHLQAIIRQFERPAVLR